MSITKEKIADWSIRLGGIAKDIGSQLHGAKVSGYSKYLIGLTSRHAILLQDIHFALKDNPPTQLTSVFILFRCLLDDFITVLYFQTGGYLEEELICHTADAWSQRFKMYRESKDINDRHFAGKNPYLANQDYIDRETAEIQNDPNCDNLFVNKTAMRFKKAPTITQMIQEIPQRNMVLAKPNVHAFVIWKLLSNYVHYSLFNYQLETSRSGSRQTEIEQCQEILSYCFKCLSMISDKLNDLGLTHEFRDVTSVHKEIFEGFQS